MKKIETVLREEKYQLEKVVMEAQKRLKTAPNGRLRIAGKRGGVEYYYISEDVQGNAVNGGMSKNNMEAIKDDDEMVVGRKYRNKRAYSNGRYMKKDEIELVRRLAQKDYDDRIVRKGRERMKAIETFLDKYEKTSLKAIYQKTNPYRRKLVFAPVISDNEYIKRWQSVEYKGKIFDDDLQEIITERGERVRSKSEKIIADKLYALGIPYRYEYPLTLEGNIKIYPDFTILKMPEREEVYLEHFGMMDDSNYVDNVIYKLNTYERNGIYIGVNLFITYETGKRTLNTKTLDVLVKKLFCVE